MTRRQHISHHSSSRVPLSDDSHSDSDDSQEQHEEDDDILTETHHRLRSSSATSTTRGRPHSPTPPPAISLKSQCLHFILSLTKMQLNITFRFITIYIFIPLIYLYAIYLRSHSGGVQELQHQAEVLRSTSASSTNHRRHPASLHYMRNQRNLFDNFGMMHSRGNNLAHDSVMASYEDDMSYGTDSWDTSHDPSKRIQSERFVYDYKLHQHVPESYYWNNDGTKRKRRPRRKKDRTTTTMEDEYHSYQYVNNGEQEDSSSSRHHHHHHHHNTDQGKRHQLEQQQSVGFHRPNAGRKHGILVRLFLFPFRIFFSLLGFFSPKKIVVNTVSSMADYILILSSYIHMWIIRIKNFILEVVGFCVATVIVMWPYLMHQEEEKVTSVEGQIDAASLDGTDWRAEEAQWIERPENESERGRRGLRDTRSFRNRLFSSSRGLRKRVFSMIRRSCSLCLYFACCWPCLCSYRITRTFLYVAFVVSCLAITVGGMTAIGIGFSTEIIWIPFFTSLLKQYKLYNGKRQTEGMQFAQLARPDLEELSDNLRQYGDSGAIVLSAGDDSSQLTLLDRKRPISLFFDPEYGIFSEYWMSSFWFWDFFAALRHVLRFYAYCGITSLIVMFLLVCCGHLNRVRQWFGGKRRRLMRILEVNLMDDEVEARRRSYQGRRWRGR